MSEDKNNREEIFDPRDSWNVKKEEVPMPEADGPQKPKFLRALENFWYHHKWKTIIILFFSIVLVVCVLQMQENDKVDIQLLYAGPKNITVPMSQNIEMAYESVMPSDFNSDGEKNASLYSLFIMSNEQILEIYDSIEDPNQRPYINTNVIAEDKKSFDNEIMAGDSVICMLDPWLYDYVREAGGFLKLEEVLGYEPDGVDEYGYGIPLSKTPFGQFFSGVSELPEDTVLCVRRITTFAQLKGQKKVEAMHEYSLDVFRAVMSFECK
jgi:hypothetical protein